MALRLVLVSAVAGLGLSLPSGDDFNACVLRARNWMNARFAEWDAPISPWEGASIIFAEAEVPAPTEPARTPTPARDTAKATAREVDETFDAVQEEMVANLAADLAPADALKALLAEARPTPARPEAPRFEPIEVGEDLHPGLADALNREAEGIAPAPPAPARSRSEQWAQAIRLTREAAYAWANLLHGPAVVTIGH